MSIEWEGNRDETKPQNMIMFDKDDDDKLLKNDDFKMLYLEKTPTEWT